MSLTTNPITQLLETGITPAMFAHTSLQRQAGRAVCLGFGRNHSLKQSILSGEDGTLCLGQLHCFQQPPRNQGNGVGMAVRPPSTKYIAQDHGVELIRSEFPTAPMWESGSRRAVKGRDRAQRLRDALTVAESW